ncbi:hypothetical protein H0H92_014088, partial [Tricholoma furcatifolium]
MPSRDYSPSSVVTVVINGSNLSHIKQQTLLPSLLGPGPRKDAALIPFTGTSTGITTSALSKNSYSNTPLVLDTVFTSSPITPNNTVTRQDLDSTRSNSFFSTYPPVVTVVPQASEVPSSIDHFSDMAELFEATNEQRIRSCGSSCISFELYATPDRKY